MSITDIPTVADLLERSAIGNGLHYWAIEGGSIAVQSNELRSVLEAAYDSSNPDWVATIAFDDNIGLWVA